MSQVALGVVLAYAVPLIVASVSFVAVGLLIWADARSSNAKLAISSDFLRDFDAAKRCERFLGTRRISLAFVLWSLGKTEKQAIVLYRLSRFMLLRKMRLLSDIPRTISKMVTGVDISPYAEIGPGFVIKHGVGIVIGKNTSIGQNVTVYQGVTTGSGRPRICDSVVVWAGAKIIGDVIVGEGSVVGANAVVLDSVPPNHVAIGVPARSAPQDGDARAGEAEVKVVRT